MSLSKFFKPRASTRSRLDRWEEIAATAPKNKDFSLLAHKFAFEYLPDHLFSDPKPILQGIQERGDSEVRGRFENSCRRHDRTLDAKDMYGVIVSVHDFPKNRFAYVIKYPSPAPVEVMDSQFSAPFYSAIITYGALAEGGLRYLVLCQSSVTGTSLRLITRNREHIELRAGSPPDLGSFLGFLYAKMDTFEPSA